MKKVGILGGTFDPIHFGHLTIAKQAKSELELDEMILMPTGHSPHKEDVLITNTKDRLAMIRLAIQEEPSLSLSTYEIDSGKINYSYLTLQSLAAENKDTVFYFVMGADSLHNLPTWRHPEIIAQNAILVVAARDHMHDEALYLLAQEMEERFKAQIIFIHLPCITVSSHEIRECIKNGLPTDDKIPRAVGDYIKSHNLYCASNF